MSTLVIIGNALTELRTLPSEIVHCCVTSPPYYGLRSYGTEPQVWGGDPNCQHAFGAESMRTVGNGPSLTASTLRGGKGVMPDEKYTADANVAASVGAFCHCGAWRGDLGLEPTPELFIQHMVEVFREVRRVLRKDGTLWLNIGDSYAASTKGSGGHNPKQDSNRGSWMDDRSWRIPKGLKPKDLLMIPAQLALALRADGWWLRSEIIWAKKAPMPESVTDRPTCAHEKVFLLTKSARYFYDAEAVKEECEPENVEHGRKYATIPRIASKGNADRGDNGGSFQGGFAAGRSSRNMRNVWHLGPNPFPEAHFATYPPEIPRRAILAGCPKGGVVLDPFFGSGTTGMVADQLGRDCVGIELSPKYAEMAERRIKKDAGLFAEFI